MTEDPKKAKVTYTSGKIQSADLTTSSPAPGRPCFLNREKSLPPLPGSVQSDAEQSSPSFMALESFLSDITVGKQGRDLQAPRKYTKSMVSLSVESLVPAAVSPQKQQASRAAQPNLESVAERVPCNSRPELNAGSAVTTKTAYAQALRASPSASTTSSSIYSQSSSTSTCTRMKDQQNASSPETQYTCSLHTHKPNKLREGLARISSELLQFADPKPRTGSDAYGAQTFLLNDSSSESRPSSPSSVHIAGSIYLLSRRHEAEEVLSSVASPSIEQSPAEDDSPTTLVLNGKAAKILGVEEIYSPKSPLLATPTKGHFPISRSCSTDQSWSSPSIIIDEPQKSPWVASGAPSAMRNSCSQESLGVLPIDNREVPATATTQNTRSGRGQCEISEEPLASPTSSTYSRNSAAVKSGSATGYREFRPLSVRIGEAFNPFDQRERNFDDANSTRQRNDSVRGNLQRFRNGVEPTEESQWPTNADPHIFNANFVAALTSKSPPDNDDHPAFRDDPFSVQRSKPFLPWSLSKSDRVSDTSKWSSSTDETCTASGDGGRDKELLPALRAVYKQATAIQRRMPLNTPRKKGYSKEASPIALDQSDGSNALLGEDSGLLYTNKGKLSSRKLTAQKTPRKRSPRNISHSPSLSRLRVKDRGPKVVPDAELGFASSSFDDDEDRGKRYRGLTALLRLGQPSKTSLQGSGEVFSDEIEDLKQNHMAQIQKLRRRLNAQSQGHDSDGIQPRHPTTGRGWHSRNLRCTTCSELACPCCDRVCCSFRACELNTKTALTTASVREEASRDILDISRHFPVGREGPTFLQCTNGTGCGKLVCPDCCGMCPDQVCGDIHCNKCRTEPWARCDWHADSGATIVVATKESNASRMPEKEADGLQNAAIS